MAVAIARLIGSIDRGPTTLKRAKDICNQMHYESSGNSRTSKAIWQVISALDPMLAKEQARKKQEQARP